MVWSGHHKASFHSRLNRCIGGICVPWRTSPEHWRADGITFIQLEFTESWYTEQGWPLIDGHHDQSYVAALAIAVPLMACIWVVLAINLPSAVQQNAGVLPPFEGLWRRSSCSLQPGVHRIPGLLLRSTTWADSVASSCMYRRSPARTVVYCTLPLLFSEGKPDLIRVLRNMLLNQLTCKCEWHLRIKIEWKLNQKCTSRCRVLIFTAGSWSMISIISVRKHHKEILIRRLISQLHKNPF